MLKILLQMALHLTIGGTNLARKMAHPLHIKLTEQQRQRHDKQNNDSHPLIQIKQKQCRPSQLEQCNSCRRDRTCQQISNSTHILFHAVKHIARMKSLAPIPSALKNMSKQVMPQSIAKADFGMCIKTTEQRRHKQL